MRKIAFMAEAHDLTVAPHNPMGPLATTANLHFDTATSNFLIQETRTYKENEIESVTNVPNVIEGFYKIPEGPGLGIDINDDFFNK